MLTAVGYKYFQNVSGALIILTLNILVVLLCWYLLIYDSMTFQQTSLLVLGSQQSLNPSWKTCETKNNKNRTY